MILFSSNPLTTSGPPGALGEGSVVTHQRTHAAAGAVLGDTVPSPIASGATVPASEAPFSVAGVRNHFAGVDGLVGDRRRGSTRPPATALTMLEALRRIVERP